jgi:hypothetical protein
MSDFDSAFATAQAKAGEILGKSGVQINPALNVEDVVVLDYEKELKGFELKQTKERVKQMLGSFEQVGEHRYKYSVPIPLSTYEQMIKDNEDLQKLPDFTSKRNKLLSLQNGGNGGNGGDGGNGGEDDDNNGNDDKESESKKLLKATSIIALLTSIVNIIRRILTAVLERGSEVKRVSENALQYGTNYSTYRDFEIQEKSMGLQEGTFSGAIGSIQNAFGNTADLNEKALEKLAPVVGSQLKDMVLMGMGASNPMGIMELILDSYFKRGLSGYNSLGKYVGEVEAQRELTSALEKAGFSELARALNNMFYVNNFGIYKDQIGSETPFRDYLNITKGIPSGFTAIEYAHLAELGQVIDNISAKFDQLGKQLKDKFLLDLEGVLNWINDLEIGMTATDKLNARKTKKLEIQKRMGELKDVQESIFNSDLVQGYINDYGVLDFYDMSKNKEKLQDFLSKNPEARSSFSILFVLNSKIKELEEQLQKDNPKYYESEYTNSKLAMLSVQGVNPASYLYEYGTMTYNQIAEKEIDRIFNRYANEEQIAENYKTKEKAKLLLDNNLFPDVTDEEREYIKAITPKFWSSSDELAMQYKIEKGEKELKQETYIKILLAEAKNTIKDMIGNNPLSEIQYNEGIQGDNKATITVIFKDDKTKNEVSKNLELGNVTETGLTETLVISGDSFDFANSTY